MDKSNQCNPSKFRQHNGPYFDRITKNRGGKSQGEKRKRIIEIWAAPLPYFDKKAQLEVERTIETSRRNGFSKFRQYNSVHFDNRKVKLGEAS